WEIVTQQLKARGMPDVIPDSLTARRKYALDRWGRPAAALDARGNRVTNPLDEWVLAGDLALTLSGLPGSDPVDVTVIAPSTMAGQAEYDLVTAPGAMPGSVVSFTQLPIGEVSIAVKRGGTLVLRKDHILLDRQKNQASLTQATAAADYRGLLGDVAK